jgi:hypothetical protein
MTTKETGGKDPQDVREDTLRSKRMIADELVSHASERNAGGLPYVLESAWHKMVEEGKHDESYMDMMIEFCELMIYVFDNERHIEYVEWAKLTGQLHAMHLNLVMECLRIHKESGGVVIGPIE